MKIYRFEQLKAWQEARETVRCVYRVTVAPPFNRDFSLCDQVRRCAVSTMGNIAEGFGREGNREFLSFLSIARGSCDELRSHLYVALDAGYISDKTFDELQTQTERTARLIGGLRRYLQHSRRRGRKFE